MKSKILSALRLLRADRRGNVAILFALAGVLLIAATGAGVDLLRAYVDEQKLTEVAALACQYATRPSVIQTAIGDYAGSGSIPTFKANVTSFVTTALQKQFPANSPSYNLTPVYSGSPTASFTVSLTSTVTTTLVRIVGLNTIAIGATADCTGSVPPAQVNNNNMLIKETFSSTSIPNGVTYITPGGAPGNLTGAGALPLQTTFPATPGFTGVNGAQWFIMGYCMELDTAAINTGGSGQINYLAPGGGQNGVELDCDNGGHTAGNSSISTQIYLEAGNYELRYYYTSRVDYPNYDPAYICGSSAADVSWANDLQTGPYTTSTLPYNSASVSIYSGTAIGANSFRTNQINVYLDQPLANGAPPTHTTLDGTETLAGSNLIDVCVYSPPNGSGTADQAVWVQRSVRIYVTTPSYYWLSFAADGHNDSFGGSIDDIILCQGTCPGPVQDNFPSPLFNPYYPGGSHNTTSSLLLPDWLNPNGLNEGLFTDTFESPPYVINDGPYLYVNPNGNLYNSKGTSGTSASGWPAGRASGWGVAPLNQVSYILSPTYEIQAYSATLGSQYIDLWGNQTSGSNNGYSRVISRPFLLVPGFYNLSYTYLSDWVFTGFNGPYCLSWSGTTGPSASALNAINYYNTAVNTVAKPGTYFVNNTHYASSLNAAVNTLAAFIANGQLSSTPISGGAVNSTTSWTNPDTNLSDTPPVTTTSTTATYRPDAISSGSYTPSANTALLDMCTYAAVPIARSINFEIQKTGYYWLTFSTQVATPTITNIAGAIDNVVLSALGSLAMTSPPLNYVPVPVGNPQPGSPLVPSSGAGYYIVADPPTYPAAMQ